MIWSGRAALVAAAGLLLAATALAQAPRRVSLTVVDHLGAGQQEETIAVYFAGVLAGTLHVDGDHPDDMFEAQVPAMDKLPFTLCGRLLRREADGSTSTHPIDNGGVMTGYAGKRWAAITIADKVFTLNQDDGYGSSVYFAAPACSAAVS